MSGRPPLAPTGETVKLTKGSGERTRGAAVRDAAFALYVAALSAVLLYGAFTWRHAPIRQVGGQYLDKRGAVYSAEDYRRFVLWERLAFTMAFGGIGACVAGAVAGRHLRSRGAGRVEGGGGA